MGCPSAASLDNDFTCAPNPRPPGPMNPIRILAFAVAALAMLECVMVAAIVPVVAAMVPPIFRKSRRETPSVSEDVELWIVSDIFWALFGLDRGRGYGSHTLVLLHRNGNRWSLVPVKLDCEILMVCMHLASESCEESRQHTWLP